MPNYVTHSLINTVAIGGMLGFEIAKGAPLEQAAPALIGAAFATFIVNPDVDMPMSLFEEWSFWKRRPLYLAWRLFWTPYAWLIDHVPAHFGLKDGHRSPLSHFPIVGTAGRALYLGLPALPILLYLHALPPLQAVAFFLYGWAIADATHYLADSVWSGVHHGYAARHHAHSHPHYVGGRRYEVKKSSRASR